jgi:hypothetical protein
VRGRFPGRPCPRRLIVGQLRAPQRNCAVHHVSPSPASARNASGTQRSRRNPGRSSAAGLGDHSRRRSHLGLGQARLARPNAKQGMRQKSVSCTDDRSRPPFSWAEPGRFLVACGLALRFSRSHSSSKGAPRLRRSVARGGERCALPIFRLAVAASPHAMVRRVLGAGMSTDLQNRTLSGVRPWNRTSSRNFSHHRPCPPPEVFPVQGTGPSHTRTNLKKG